MKGRTGMVVVLGLLVVAVVLPMVLSITRGGGGHDQESPDGLLALQLLYEELGVDVTVRERLPRDAGGVGSVVLFAPGPLLEDEASERIAVETAERLAGFVERGGWVVGMVGDGADVDFMTDALAPVYGSALYVQLDRARRPDDRVNVGGVSRDEELRVGREGGELQSGGWSLNLPAIEVPRQGGSDRVTWPLRRDRENTGRSGQRAANAAGLFGLRGPGPGGAALTTLGPLLTNTELQFGDHALIAARLLEETTRLELEELDVTLLFAGGGQRNWLAYALTPPHLYLTLALAALVALLAWAGAAERAFPVQPPLAETLTARARARGIANLMRRSGHVSWPADLALSSTAPAPSGTRAAADSTPGDATGTTTAQPKTTPSSPDRT